MDFGKAFTFMFEDPDWVRKLGIGTILTLIGVLFISFLIGILPLLVVTGYTVQVVRNVMMRRERPLPEWNDMGQLLGEGFKIFLATLVWLLPVLVLMIPITVSAIMMDQNGRGMEAIGVPIMICGYCLVILWSLFVALMTPAIYARIAATGRIASAFELGRMWAFTRDNLGNIIVAILLGIVAGFIAGIGAMLGLIALIIGVLVTIPLASLWQMLVNAHLYGQIAGASVSPIE